MASLTDAQGRCLHSFWHFWLEALEAPRHDKPHKEMAEFSSDFSQMQKLMLVPRGCWKTSEMTTAFPLWMGLRAFFLDGKTDFRSLIDSETSRLSGLVLDSIARYMANGVAFRQIFGNLYDSNLHTSEYLDFTFNQKRSGGIKEPNFLASGLKSAKTGLHFDLITLDDLVTEANFSSLAQREKVWLHYRLMYSILENDQSGQGTYFHVVGTRYHDDDMYGRILKQEKDQLAEGKPPSFATMVRGAWDDDGELFFPDVLTMEALEKKKTAQKGLFWANYFNDPNKESAPFKLEQLHYLSLLDFPKKLRLRRMTVDVAIKEEQVAHGDFNCITVGAFNAFGQPYLLDVSLQRDLDPTSFLELFFNMACRWQPEQIFVEEASGSMLREFINAEMQRRGLQFNIYYIKSNKLAGKMTRWMKLQPYAHRGGIHIAQEIPAATKAELEDQWSRCPFAQYDDFMDSLEMLFTWMAQTAPEEGGQPFDTDAVLEDAAHAPVDGQYQTLEQVFPHIRAMRAKRNQDEQIDTDASPDNESERLLAGGVNWQ